MDTKTLLSNIGVNGKANQREPYLGSSSLFQKPATNSLDTCAVHGVPCEPLLWWFSMHSSYWECSLPRLINKIWGWTEQLRRRIACPICHHPPAACAIQRAAPSWWAKSPATPVAHFGSRNQKPGPPWSLFCQPNLKYVKLVSHPNSMKCTPPRNLHIPTPNPL